MAEGGEDSDDSIDKDGLIDALMKLDPIVAKQMGIYETYKEEIGLDFEHPALSEIQPKATAADDSTQQTD